MNMTATAIYTHRHTGANRLTRKNFFGGDVENAARLRQTGERANRA